MILSLLSSIAIVSGLMIVKARNPVHSVLFFILVFCNTAGLLLFLGLDFFAMIFLVVHIGAIAVFVFNIQLAEIQKEVLRYAPVSAIIGILFASEIFFILDNESIPLLPSDLSLKYTVYAEKACNWTNLEALGNLLYTFDFVWFLISSLLLVSTTYLVKAFVPMRARFLLEEQILVLLFSFAFFGVMNTSLLLLENSVVAAPTTTECLPQVLFMDSGTSSGIASAEPSIPTSSDPSVGTFRAVYMLDSEAELFQRIAILEQSGFYNIPPQSVPGQYADTVQAILNQAETVAQYRSIWDKESTEVSALEVYAELENQLVEKTINESRVEDMIRMTRKDGAEIRENAADFIKSDLGDILDFPTFQQLQEVIPRAEELIQEIKRDGAHSEFYRRFFSDLTDEDTRRNCGLPLVPKD